MPRSLLDSLKVPVDNSFHLLEKFIEACPEDLWGEKKGGWLIWQQVYHCIAGVSFFISIPSKLDPLASAEVASLAKLADKIVGKLEIKAALLEAKERVDKFAASLSDAELLKQNEPLFAAIKMDISLGGTFSLVAAHNMYHLGACDAALRDRGLAGVF